MRKNNVLSYTALFIWVSGFLLLPFASVSAHETHTYEINGAEYQVTIGSLGEPVVVDDKTGLDLRITRNGQPYVGAADELQVEMIAGDVSRVDNIEAAYGEEGVYDTTFIATVPTTLQYRIFGELEGASFDQTYTCNPAGHPRSEENTERIEVSENVTQILARGNFGCPVAKEAMGFPAEAPSVYNLENDISAATTELSAFKEESQDPMVLIALILGAIGAFFGLVAYRRTS